MQLVWNCGNTGLFTAIATRPIAHPGVVKVDDVMRRLQPQRAARK